MITTRALAEQRVILRNISWQTFKAMLTETGEDRVSRMTYDRGTLEIMTPLMPQRFIKESKEIGEVAMVRSFRNWVRQQLDPHRAE